MAGVLRLAAFTLSSLAFASSAPAIGDTVGGTTILAPVANGSANVDNLHCYHACRGVSRWTAIQALDSFCTNVTGHQFKTPADNVWGMWTYVPSHTVFQDGYDEGEILMTINVTSNGECALTNVMTYDACRSNAIMAIDSCNTASTYGKQGGIFLHDCLQYEVQPNPKYWPKCQEEPPTDLKSIEARIADVSGTSQSAGTSDSPFLNCFNLCYGEPRDRAVDAVNSFCNKVNGRTFTTSADSYTDHFLYEADSKPQYYGYYDEGDIRMSINITAGAECSPGVTMTFDECYTNVMHRCVDGCDTHGENGKQGGWFVDGCSSLTYEFQPNPLYWPFCYFGSNQSSSPRRHELQAGDNTTRDVESTYGNALTTTMVQSLSAGALTAMTTESPLLSAQIDKAGLKDNYGSPYCSNACHGVHRQALHDASSAACDWIIDKGSTFTTDADIKVFSANYTHREPSAIEYAEGGWEEGQILVRVEVIPGMTCDPTFVMDHNRCYSWLMYGIVDQCDDHGENWKQGGYITYGCMNFTINPNPIYWPECAPSLSHSDLWSTDAALLDAPGLSETGHEEVINTTSIAPRSESSSSTTLSSGDDWGPPFCLNTCYGVTRLVAAKASDAFAAAMGDHNFTTLADDAWLDWYYEPAHHYFQGPGWTEEGHVKMTINVIPGVTCDPTTHLYNSLTYQILMHGIIDKCNTDSTKGKQGGWLVMGCLNYTINPNPDYWPECKFGSNALRNRSAGLDANGTLASSTAVQSSVGEGQPPYA